MEKAHSRINWENYPSIATPLNEANLNKMDKALDEVDNRVLGLDTAKLDKATANTMVKDVAFDEATGIFTVTLLNGTTKTINTQLEKVVTNFRYDNQSQKLILTLVDGSEQQVDLSSLISNYEFADGDIIAFTIGSNGKVTANVKDGSVTEDKLQPNFLADIKVEVAKGKSYSDSSYENATTSSNASAQAKQYRDEAEVFRNQTQAMSGVEIATTEKAGLVKPDGTTITVDADGTVHSLGGQGTVDYTELENKPSINGTELNGNKTLNDLGIASATELAKTNTKVDTIIEKADLGIKETANGEEIHLTDSAEGKAVEFALYGKAKQNTTQGNQLFDKSTIIPQTSLRDSGVTYTNTAWETSNYIPLKPLITYTISQETANYFQYRFCFYNSNEEFISLETVAKAETKKFTFNTPENTAYMRFSYSISVSGEAMERKNIMLNEGGEALPWEEYSGGMPSPNPQYPQPIEVSGASGSVAVKSCGKNLLKNEATSQTINGVTFTVNEEDKSVTVNGKPTATTFFYLVGDSKNESGFKLGGKYIASSKNYISSSCYMRVGVSGGNHYYDITKEKEMEFDENSDIYVSIRLGKDAEINNVTLYPMIRLATDTDDTYEPYKETLATIPTENGLAGIKVSSGGNYTDQNGQQWICDEVVKYADGSGEYIQNIEKRVLNGTENYIKYNYIYYIGGINIKNGKDIICSHFVPSVIKSTSDVKYDLQVDASNKQLRFMYSAMETVEDFKAWLQENNATVFYRLEEPIHTPLTAEEIAEIEKLHTLYPITNISNDFDCGMRIDYVGEGIITTNTEIPIVEPKDEEELESGDNIVTLFGKISKKLKNVGKAVVEVVDNLLSTSTDLPLSANQGRVLDEKITQTNESLADKESTLNGRINDVNENLTQKETALYNEINTLSENIDSQVSALDERITELSESATSGSLTSRTIMVQDFFETVPSTVNTAFGYHQASICGNVVMVNMHIEGITGTTKIGNVKDEYKSILSSSYIPVCVTSQQNKYICVCSISSSGDVYIQTGGATITASDTLMITGAYICKGKTE